MDCIYIAPLSKALYNLCLSFTHSPIHTPTAIGCHARHQPARQVQLGVRCLTQGLRHAQGGIRTGNPPTARRQLLPPESYGCNASTACICVAAFVICSMVCLIAGVQYKIYEMNNSIWKNIQQLSMQMVYYSLLGKFQHRNRPLWLHFTWFSRCITEMATVW